MKRKPKGIQPCDRVKIVLPFLFVRCGYPLDVRTEADRFSQEMETPIKAFLESMGIKGSEWQSRAIPEIAQTLAYAWCKQNAFGGRKRTIFLHHAPELEGREFSVLSVRFVKTGEYEPASCSYHGDDWDPPYLSGEKTHRILELGSYHEYEHHTGNHPEIEATNVEKIQPNQGDE